MRDQIVTGLLVRRGRALLCHRQPARRTFPDVWDLPGGHVEPGERADQALVRELREELGVDVDAKAATELPPLNTCEYDMRVWLVERWHGDVRNAAPEEHDALAWFAPPSLSFLRLGDERYLPLVTDVLNGRGPRVG